LTSTIARTSAFHCESHRGLVPVVRTTPRTDRELDAIIVPSARSVGHLDEAMRRAAEAGVRLVVLCSLGTTAAEVAAAAADVPGLVCMPIDVEPDYCHGWLTFATTRHPRVAERRSDLSLKRNLGLLLTRMVGWDRVLFLDDDIRGVTAQHMREVASALDRYTAVGMVVDDFPDNSVICHAHRDAGGKQDVFVGGSALAVRVSATTPFFPQVYNEDWLFLLDAVRRGTVARAGSVNQLRYDPFDNWARAESEEFGDVIAEGLMTLLHTSATAPRGTNKFFWERVLRRRRLFIESVRRRTTDERVLLALKAAEARRGQITAAECASYIAQWQLDMDVWEERFRSLPTGLPLWKALKELELKAPEGEGRCVEAEPQLSTARPPWRRRLFSPAHIGSFRKASGSGITPQPSSGLA
jgi:hypothetical protein